MGRGAWQATVQGLKEPDMSEVTQHTAHMCYREKGGGCVEGTGRQDSAMPTGGKYL